MIGDRNTTASSLVANRGGLKSHYHCVASLLFLLRSLELEMYPRIQHKNSCTFSWKLQFSWKQFNLAKCDDFWVLKIEACGASLSLFGFPPTLWIVTSLLKKIHRILKNRFFYFPHFRPFCNEHLTVLNFVIFSRFQKKIFRNPRIVQTTVTKITNHGQ